jgi:chaperonin GroES
MELRPLGDRVVVEPLTETTTVSGIVIPDTAKDKPQRGKVVSVGSGRLLDNGTRVPPEVKAGDVVLILPGVGNHLRIDNKDVLLVSEHDILAVVAGAPALV